MLCKYVIHLGEIKKTYSIRLRKRNNLEKKKKLINYFEISG